MNRDRMDLKQPEPCENREQNTDASFNLLQTIDLLRADSGLEQSKTEATPEQIYLNDCYRCGMDAYWGLNGEKPDVVAGREWFQKAAELGHAPSQTELGFSYANMGDYENAVKLYREAAQQGYAEAQVKLGYCYYHGKGVEKDVEEAKRWWQSAAKQGSRLAQTLLNEKM